MKSSLTMNKWLLVPSPVEIARSTVPTCQNTIISKSGEGQRFALGEELFESQEMRLKKLERSNGNACDQAEHDDDVNRTLSNWIER